MTACALTFTGRAAEAGAPARMHRPTPEIVIALQGVLLGPLIAANGAGVQLDADGRMRTLELDDRATLHVRFTIPF